MYVYVNYSTDVVSHPMHNDCRITVASATPATLVSTVRLILMSASRCHARTMPPAGSGRTSLVLTSAMPLQQALTVHACLDSLVT